ncbi:MAG: holdfast anchoring protein HfaB [Pseudomonadota bacterium]
MTNAAPKSQKRRLRASLAAIAGAMVAAGCVSPFSGNDGLYAKPIGNAPVTANPTAYSEALVCMGHYSRANRITPPRIAVGRILDYTGKADLEGGRRVTQGASLMAISALAKAGARLVERFDTSVSELELKYANNRLIGEEAPDAQFREIMAGSIPGSDFYVVGGITELNYNIRSVGADAFFADPDPTDAKAQANAKLFVINVALDLRMVETETLEVVDVISLQKQIIGRELSAGVFDFANGNIFDIGVGGRAQEPIQLAVRATVERAILEMMANLYGATGAEVCDEVEALASTNGITGDFRPVYNTLEENNANSRASVSRWNERREPELRGRS